MGLALTACDNYKEPNPPAQYNPQVSILNASEVTAESIVSSEVYDLTSMTEDKVNIELARLSCSTLPEGYTMGALAYVSADDFKTSYPLSTEVKESGEPGSWNVEIRPDSLQVVYNDNISMEEVETTLKVRILATTIIGGQVAIVGGLDHFYGPYNVTILPGEPAKFEMPGPFLYTPGNSNGWSQDNSQKLYTMDDGKTFIGFALLQDEFKFTDQPDWNGTNYGAGDAEGELSTEGGNIVPPVNGLYWCNVNVDELTYELTLISTIGAIGGFNGWSSSVALTTTNDLIWTGDIEFDGGEFKFRCNDAWDIDFGGAYKWLVYKGDNLKAPGTGVYSVTLDLSSLPYSCSFVKK